MPIDTSIYNLANRSQNDSLDTYGKFLTMKELVNKNAASDAEAAKKLALSNVLKQNTITDEKGNTTLNRSGAISGLYKENPEAAESFKKMLRENDLDELTKTTQLGKTLAFQSTPENWSVIRSKANELGLMNADKLPEIATPEFIDRWKMSLLEGEKQLANAMEEKKFASDTAFRDKKFENENSQFDRNYSQRDREFDVRLAEARAEKNLMKQEKQTEKMQALETPYGLANTVDDAKQLKTAHESKLNFDSKLNELIDLRKNKGAEVLDREAVARAGQLSKDLLLEYKNMAKLGVLSQSDEKIINAIIPTDPLAFTPSSLAGQDPILSNLIKFKADSDKDFATRVQTRTREGIAQYKENPPERQESVKQISVVAHPQIDKAFEWAKQNPNDPRAAEIMRRIGK